MKVILHQAVPRLGRRGEVVEVTEAYARNFLIPKKIALPATAEIIEHQAATQHQVTQQRHRQLEQADQARRMLEGQHIDIVASANTRGRLYAALKTDQVMRQLEKNFKITLASVHMNPDHLKEVGTHQVQLTWPDQNVTTVSVVVVAK